MDDHPYYLAQSPQRGTEAQAKRDGQALLFIIAYVWLDKYFSRGDYLRQEWVKELIPGEVLRSNRSNSGAELPDRKPTS